MALMHHALFLLPALAFYLGFPPAVVEPASCPAATINASAICEEVGSNDVKTAANLSFVVCDNFQNLSQANSSFVVRALDHVLQKRNDVTQDVVKVLVNQVDREELEAGLEEFNRKIINSSLVSPAWKAAVLRALWDEALRNEDRFNETSFVAPWFQQRLRLFISAISTDMLQCLRNETLHCEQYQAIVKGLDAEFTAMTPQTQADVFHSFLLPYLKGSDSNDSSLRCYDSNSSFLVFLEEMFRGFYDLLRLTDLRAITPSPDLQKVINTVPPDDLASLFSRHGFLNDDPFLTAVLQNYEKTGMFVDRFNQKDIVASLPNATKLSLLAGVWPAVVSSDNNETEGDKWLTGRLSPYFTFLNGEILNGSETLNASCRTFQKIVAKLNENVALFEGREEEMYYSIKAYQAATDAKPRCYNGSDPETSGWLSMYLRTYIRYSTARDMRLLTNHSATIFQDLAFNRDNLELLYRHRVRKDLAEMYAVALFAVAPDFSLNSLPDQLLCFARHSTLIPTLSQPEALSLVARVNLQCNSSTPTASDRQLASMLVAQVKTLDGQALVALGQQAVGLTTGQIANLTAAVLSDAKVLQSLGRVAGWNRGQSQMLAGKILRDNFTLDSLEVFERMGTLVPGLPSAIFDGLSANVTLGLAKSARFVRILQQGPEHLKKAFVVKILANGSSPRDILDNVPDGLIGQVPSSLLVLREPVPDLEKLNAKPWSPAQAAVLFGEVLSNTENYTQLSASILQGFQCSAASKLSPGQLSALAREVKVKNASLSEEQLSCMARLLTRNNRATNFSAYPPDVLLFFPLNKVDNQSCEDFYGLASQGNLTLLTNGSTQRTILVENALQCFGVENASLSAEQLRHLGVFVCDMDASAIETSDPGILENLKRCPDLTTPQRAAVNALLSSGKTTYRTPSSWDDGTLESLGTLTYYINRTLWKSINEGERRIFIRTVVEGYDRLSASQKEKAAFFFKAVRRETAPGPRAKRATEACRSNPITTSTLEDSLFLVYYDTAQQFNVCLSDEVLKANLALLMEQPLPSDYLSVIKARLDKVYPEGIPEDQLKLLGSLSRLYSADEIGKWRVTSGDTLAALLNPDDGPWTEAQFKQLIARYTGSGGVLTGPLLDLMGGKYLCYLDEDQLRQIDPEAIRHTEMLDLSTCSQSKKDLLYGKAHLAFARQEGTDAYYPLMKPYLGGAPVEDLKKLAGSQVAMDVNTFLSLNPEEMEKLSVQDVKGLLGVNLPGLKEEENHPSITRWIRSHYQSELDTLRIGLTGGLPGLPPTDARSTAVDITSAASSDAPTTPTVVAPVGEFTTSSPNDTATPGSRAPTSSGITSVAATGSHLTPSSDATPAADETSPPITATNDTIVAIPKVDFPNETTTVSSNVTELPDEALSGTPASITGRGLNATSAASGSSVPPSTTVDSAVALDTEVAPTSSSFAATSDGRVSGIPVPVSTAGDVDTTTSSRPRTDSTANDTALLSTTVDSTTGPTTNVTTSGGTISGMPTPVFTAGDTNTTVSSTTRVEPNSTATNGTALPTTAGNSTVAAPTNATTGSDVTLSGSLSPGPTRDTTLTSSSKTTPATANTTSRTSPPPVATSSNPTVAPNTTSPTTATLTSHTTGASTSSTRSQDLTSTKSEATSTSTGRPLVPPEPRPDTTTPPTTNRPTSKPPPRTKPPVHPTPNGYINVEPLNALSCKASLSRLLLAFSLVAGLSAQRWLL